MKRQLVITLLLFNLMAAACGTSVEIEGTPIPLRPTSPVPTVTSHATVSTATPSPVPANLQMYRNTTAGFELDYPADWIADTSGISNGVILWSRKLEGPGADGVPADVVKMDIVIPYVTVQSLDELAAWEKQSIADSSHTVLEEQQLQLPSGLTVVRLRVEGGLALLAIVNNWPLIIAGYGDLSRFDAVTQTLRPSKSGETEHVSQ